MDGLSNIILIITVIIATVLIGLILLQKSADGGASGALMGGRDLNLFANTKERGSEKIISLLTISLIIMFITFALALRL